MHLRTLSKNLDTYPEILKGAVKRPHLLNIFQKKRDKAFEYTSEKDAEEMLYIQVKFIPLWNIFNAWDFRITKQNISLARYFSENAFS